MLNRPTAGAIPRAGPGRGGGAGGGAVMDVASGNADPAIAAPLAARKAASNTNIHSPQSNDTRIRAIAAVRCKGGFRRAGSRQRRRLKRSRPHNEMGAGIAASPQCAERSSVGVRQLGDPGVSCSSILTHQLRRRFVPWSYPEARSRSSAALLGLIPLHVACFPEETACRTGKNQLFRRL